MMWEHMTPTSKKKLKASLQKSSKANDGINRAFRRELVINLSNPISVDDTETDLQRKVNQFFENDNVACINPDTQKMVGDKPQRLALSSYSCLHQRFIAANTECSYRQFVRYIPLHVQQPKSASDWGTCLCSYCLNPALKCEALMNKGLLEKFNVEEQTTGTAEVFNEMLENIAAVGKKHADESILYHKWTRVPNPLSQKGSMISRKMPVIDKVKQISTDLSKELTDER